MSQMSFDLVFPRLLINPCSSEPILFFGNIQGFIHDFDDEKKGTHHIMHLNLDQIMGIGRITGEKYAVNNTDKSIDVYGFDKPDEEKVEVILEITGQGRVPNFIIFITLRLKLDDENEVTANISGISAKCG